MSKEHIFTVEVNGNNVAWRCVVDQDEIITYEGDVECERLKITNPEKKVGVIQVDAKVKVFDDVVPFGMENGIPYLVLEGERWYSDTTQEDNLCAQIRKTKLQVYAVFAIGIAAVIYYIVGMNSRLPLMDMMPIAALVCISMSMMQMFRLKQELDALGRPFSWKL